MGFWEALTLVFMNWKYVTRFLEIAVDATEKGYNAYDLNKSLKRLERGFRDVKTVEDAADAAASINDTFRK